MNKEQLILGRPRLAAVGALGNLNFNWRVNIDATPGDVLPDFVGKHDEVVEEAEWCDHEPEGDDGMYECCPKGGLFYWQVFLFSLIHLIIIF